MLAYFVYVFGGGAELASILVNDASGYYYRKERTHDFLKKK